MSTNDGGPAFPLTIEVKEGDIFRGAESTRNERHVFTGMTLRDYFAAKAMAGLLASEREAHPQEFAHDAYLYADAMIAQRGKL